MSLGRCSFEKWGTWQQLQIWVFQQTLLWGVLRLKTPTICTFEAFILNKSKRSGRLQGIIIQDDKTSRFPSVVWYLCMYFLQFFPRPVSTSFPKPSCGRFRVLPDFWQFKVAEAWNQAVSLSEHEPWCTSIKCGYPWISYLQEYCCATCEQACPFIRC